jgi:outer membrane protein assembly factor BamD (BamD/ComL family)
MTLRLTFCMLAVLIAAPAFADCTPPDDTVQIPDGSMATREEMVAAQKAVVAYDTAVKTYTDCLQQEQADKVAAGGDKVKLQKVYSKLNNDQVEKVQQLADRFNTELKAFKAKSAG